MRQERGGLLRLLAQPGALDGQRRLLAETQHDPDLREYDTIILGEAHERSLNIDFLTRLVQVAQ